MLEQELWLLVLVFLTLAPLQDIFAERYCYKSEENGMQIFSFSFNWITKKVNRMTNCSAHFVNTHGSSIQFSGSCIMFQALAYPKYNQSSLPYASTS